jgi:protein gp37
VSTKIAWTDETWNPVVGCSPASVGCQNCYAVKSARRQAFLREQSYARYAPLIENLWNHDSRRWRWSGKVELFPERLEQPLHWRRPRMIFPVSMGDWLHPSVPLEFRERMKIVAALTPQHTYQSLTKRASLLPAAMLARVSWPEFRRTALDLFYSATPRKQLYTLEDLVERAWERYKDGLPNWWAGVTVENPDALWRIDHLLQAPAAVRFVSCEPLLGPLNLRPALRVRSDAIRRAIDAGATDWPGCGMARHADRQGIHGVIVGGESGPEARPCHVNWIRSIRDQCREAKVPCFIKQLGLRPFGPRVDGHPDHVLGEWPLKNRLGADPAEWPADLGVQELPGEART